MKTPASIRRILTVASLATLLVLLNLNTLTADKPPARAHTPPTTPSEMSKTAYDLEIVDGVLTRSGREATLDNVIDALRERYSKANIVLSPGLKKVQILDLKLRTGSIWEELEAIRVASGGKFEWLGPNSPVFSGERTPNNPN